MDNNLTSSAAATGDIWSTGFLSFESPLKDLLDSNQFTLEQLLAEDELLQELRGMHPQLLVFLSTEAAVTRLIQHVIRNIQTDPPLLPLAEDTSCTNANDSEHPQKPSFAFPPPEEAEKQTLSAQEQEQLRNIRYPYMACEVICSQINGILDVLVDGHVVTDLLTESITPKNNSNHQDDQQSQEGDNTKNVNNGTHHDRTDPRPPRLLDLLCSVLVTSNVGELDDYRAGYLDKILGVLCRTRPQAMTAYVQDRGMELLGQLQAHLYSHSIMQIVQRFLLPSNNSGPPSVPCADKEDEENNTFTCRWSECPQAMDMLLQSLLRTEKHDSAREVDEAKNASEVLMTLIQNSPLSSRHLVILTTHPVLDRVVDAASILGDALSPHESKLTSAVNVLESLILQLGGYGAVGGAALAKENVAGDADDQSLDLAESPSAATAETLVELLPGLLERFCGLLQHPSTKTWKSPMQFAHHAPQSLLGMSRLKIVRLLESLVLLGVPAVDRMLCESPALEICLDLFWEFSWCSMLHQSVANLLVHVFEGANERMLLQKYFLINCSLLGRLMDSFECEEGGVVSDARATHEEETSTSELKSSEPVIASANEVLAVSDDDVDAALDQETGEKDMEESGEEPESVPALAEEKAVEDDEEVKSHIPSFRLGYMGHVIIICQALVHASSREANEPPVVDAVEGGMSSIDLEMGSSVEINGLYEKMSYIPAEDPNQGSETSLDFDQDDSDTFDDEDERPDLEAENELIIAKLIQSDPLRSKWEEFVSTTLSAESAIQSTPLGGLSGTSQGGDPLHSHSPDMGKTELEHEFIQGKGILVTGEVIDMDDNDLDMAATMMEALGGLASGPEGVEPAGESKPEQSHDYIFDDPLGNGRFSQDYGDDKQGEGPLVDGHIESKQRGAYGETEERSEVPVMDLFAGNFSLENEQPSEAIEEAVSLNGPVWSNFANFDDAFASAETSSSDSDETPTSSDADQVSPVVEAEVAGSDAEDIFGSSPSHHLLLGEEEENEEKVEGPSEGDEDEEIGPFQEAKGTGEMSEVQMAAADNGNTPPKSDMIFSSDDEPIVNKPSD